MRGYLHIVFGLLLVQLACQAGPSAKRPGVAAVTGQPAAADDDVLFHQTLRQFQTAVARGDTSAVRGLLYFPFLTAPQWTNDDLRDHSADTSGGKIGTGEFDRYYPRIFHEDVARLLPKAGEDDLSVVTRDTREDYYRRLEQETDPGSQLYEMYMQYPARGSDGYFGFVFGRVAGQYKVISYYAKWPVIY